MLPYLQIYLKLADFWLWLQIEILNFRWQIFGSKTPKNGRFLTLTKKSTKIGRFSAIWLRFCRFFISWVSQFWSHCSKICSKMKFTKLEFHFSSVFPALKNFKKKISYQQGLVCRSWLYSVSFASDHQRELNCLFEFLWLLLIFVA